MKNDVYYIVTAPLVAGSVQDIRVLVTAKAGHKVMQPFPATLSKCDREMLLNFNNLLN